ncbi:GNAT family protein [Streptomyces sp. NPDC047813]|uniref:GNAT family protein n=1 Tax=Streptomyces sp. NPDC047813 TaxID=3154608 RepID=UPI0033BFB976
MAHQIRGDNIRFTVHDLTGEVPVPAGIATLLPDSAVHAYEKAGFRIAGRLRQAGYWLGQVCDELIMDALAAEFTGPSVIVPLES